MKPKEKVTFELPLEGTAATAIRRKLDQLRQLDETYARERQRLLQELLGMAEFALTMAGYDTSAKTYAVEDITPEKIVFSEASLQVINDGRN